MVLISNQKVHSREVLGCSEWRSLKWAFKDIDQGKQNLSKYPDICLVAINIFAQCEIKFKKLHINTYISFKINNEV